MNKVSIITVNLNNADGLCRTIKSVIEQTLRPFEFIIVDGKSQDNSIEIIKANNESISYWISEKDSGVFNAMNKGIQVATGDYCLFLNSGDFFPSEKVLEDIFANQTHEYPFINGNQINNFGTHQQRVASLKRPLTLYDFYWGTIKHQATFIRRNLFEKYGYYDESLKIISDWKFFLLTIGLNNEQPFFVDVDIVNFEWNGLSTNPEFEEKHRNERQIVLDSYIPKSIQADYKRLKYLNNYNYIAEAMNNNGFLNKIIRLFVKIFQ